MESVHENFAGPRTLITPEGGIAVLLTNLTGADSVKGTIVSASTTPGGFKVQANEYDAIGAVYNGGVPTGGDTWVVICGLAEVLLEDGTAATAGNWCHMAATDGRADCSLTQPSGGGFVEASEHFKEIGHCLETKTAGTNVLAKIVLHFN